MFYSILRLNTKFETKTLFLGVYVGTRNYVLEAVIAKLQRLRSIDNINLGEDDDDSQTKSTNEAPEDALLSEATQSDAATSESVVKAKILAPKGG